MLDNLHLPPNTRLFTSYAVTMYTNIKTKEALKEICNHITVTQGRYRHLNPEAVRQALHLVFNSDIFALGDTYWRQILGTAMGTPPAPAWATFFLCSA